MKEALPSDPLNMKKLFLPLIFCIAVLSNPMARAEDDAAYMIGLEVHASKSVTPAEADKISRYFLHNIAKWSPGAAIVLYEGDTRGGGFKGRSQGHCLYLKTGKDLLVICGEHGRDSSTQRPDGKRNIEGGYG